MVRGAVSAGAAGVAFGRNVWQYPNPRGLVRALHQVIHEGTEPVEAAGLLNEPTSN
jgi:DhnA family fructose-bisphosphate aldolase class Ia